MVRYYTSTQSKTLGSVPAYSLEICPKNWIILRAMQAKALFKSKTTYLLDQPLSIRLRKLAV